MLDITSRYASAVLFVLLISGAVIAAERKPNVVLVFTDDQGTVDANCYGSDELVTDAMDKLARRGVRFTQFYAAAPVCSPSRAGLLTGRYPVRAGVPGNVGQGTGMPQSEVTIADMLRAAGYATAHIGKWHLGHDPATRPEGQGFDYTFGHMQGCIDNYAHFFYWSGPNRHDLWRNGKEVFENGRFFPDLMVDEATKFIEKNKDRPFFIYFASNAPHYPYQGEPEWLEHYKKLKYPRNLYAAFLSTLDQRIGKLMAKVDELSLTNDTIFIFQSDHGHSTEGRAHFGGGSSGPYRGAKFSLFEGGIRVPAIISWPGRLPSGETRDQLAHSCDWLPTIAELCGVELPKARLDGKSINEVICNAKATSPHETLHWQVGGGPKAQWAVRRGPWKLIGNVRESSDSFKDYKPLTGADKKLWLSNLTENPGETVNLAKQHPEIVKQLSELRQRWTSTTNPSP